MDTKPASETSSRDKEPQKGSNEMQEHSPAERQKQDGSDDVLRREHLRQELTFFAENALAEAFARERQLFAAHFNNGLSGTHVLAENHAKTTEIDTLECPQSTHKVEFIVPDISPPASAFPSETPCTLSASVPPAGDPPSDAPPADSAAAAVVVGAREKPVMKHFATVATLDDVPELMFARRHYRNQVAADELRAIEKEVAVHQAVVERASGRGSILAASVGDHQKATVVPVPLDANGNEMPMDAAFQFCRLSSLKRRRGLCRSCVLATLLAPVLRFQEATVRLVTNDKFDYAVGVLIFINAACIGAQTDHAAQHIGQGDAEPFKTLEVIFALCFSAELLARIVAYNVHFFCMPGRLWNLFDCVLVGTQIAEQVMSSGEAGGFSAMRILRILRVIRIVRLVRVLRLIGELRTIVICVAGSMRSLFWTVVLLFVMIYIMGVYFTQVVSDFRAERGDTPEVASVRYYFGSLGRSVLSLYQAMSGGISWDVAVSPLMLNIDPFLGVVFALYIAFALLAIMNVVTGVFVETALETAKNDKEVSLVHHTRELFLAGDKDHNGNLNWNEFEGLLSSREMHDLFTLIGIDASEAKALFQLLDLEESGTISFDDFLNGCLRLRGNAKSIDLMTVMYETRRLSRSHWRQLKGLQKGLAQLSDQLGLPADACLHSRR